MSKNFDDFLEEKYADNPELRVAVERRVKILRLALEMRDAADEVSADDFNAPATLRAWARRLEALT